MIAVLNFGRLLMVGWIVYGLVLIFAPGLLHRSPDQVGGAVQVGVAFGLGWLLHSGVHCTVNIVVLRFWLNCISALALWFMAGRAALHLFL